MKQKLVDDLAVAVLAVNSYPVTRAWDLLPSLRQRGLLDADRVAARSPLDVVEDLRACGYDRGKITDIVGPRFRTLMEAVRNGDLEPLERAVASRNRGAADELLLGVRGIGPRVAETAWMLLTSGSPS